MISWQRFSNPLARRPSPEAHIVAESAGLLVVAPFALAVALAPGVSSGLRAMGVAVALGTVAVDGAFVAANLRARRSRS